MMASLVLFQEKGLKIIRGYIVSEQHDSNVI